MKKQDIIRIINEEIEFALEEQEKQEYKVVDDEGNQQFPDKSSKFKGLRKKIATGLAAKNPKWSVKKINDEKINEMYDPIYDSMLPEILVMISAGVIGVKKAIKYLKEKGLDKQEIIDVIKKAKSKLNESLEATNKKTGKDVTKHVNDYMAGDIDKKEFEKLTGLKKESVNEDIDGLKVGMTVLDGMNDQLKVIKIAPKSIHLKPLTYKGPISIFPDDFLHNDASGNDYDIDDFWTMFDLKESVNEATKHTIVVYNGKRLAVEPGDIERLKSGKDVVGNSTKYAGQEEWIQAKGKWKIVESINENEDPFGLGVSPHFSKIHKMALKKFNVKSLKEIPKDKQEEVLTYIDTLASKYYVNENEGMTKSLKDIDANLSLTTYGTKPPSFKITYMKKEDLSKELEEEIVAWILSKGGKVQRVSNENVYFKF